MEYFKLLMFLAVVFGFLSVCTAQTSSSICPSCSFKQDMTMVKIPEPMTLDDYNNEIVGYTWSEIYYAIRNPRPWDPWYNYKMSFQPVSAGTSLESVVADAYTGIDTGICIKVNTTLHLLSLPKDGAKWKARFTHADTNVLTVFSSSCPSKYFWMLKCDFWTDTHCQRIGMQLGLAVKDRGYFKTMENMPLVSMLTDLRRDMDIVFGNEDFSWSWTAGDSQFC